jgi:hypothetical protein
MAVSMFGLLGLIGLALDTAYVQQVKTRMQTAADAAAIGAVDELKMNGSAGVVTAGKGDAGQNGFTDGVNGVTVTINNPPLSGYYTGDRTAAEALISQNVPTFFMSVLGFRSMVVRARAVSRQGSGPDCLYVLDSSGTAFSISGGATVNVSCGIVIDSGNSSALSASGGARVTAAAINIVGNYSSSGGAVLSPTPHTGANSQPDPLAYLTAPAVAAGCPNPGVSVSGGATATITEGVYCNGISVSGNSTLNLSPGVYILKGGGMSVSGGSHVNGTGVTIYNTKDATHSYQPISFSGGTFIHLTAPTSGDLSGILMFQDRSVMGGGQSSLSGGANQSLVGSLYFPTTALSYSGGAATDAYTIIVAKSISFSGGSVMRNDYSTLQGGSPIKGTASLSE